MGRGYSFQDKCCLSIYTYPFQIKIIELLHTVESSTYYIVISVCCMLYAVLLLLDNASSQQLQSVNFYCMLSAEPDRVSGVTFLPSPDENSLSVEWNRPYSDAPILHYEVQYRQRSGSRSWQGPVTATTEAVTLRSLVPSVSYGVRVRAVSTIREGRYSSEKILRG